MVRIRNLFVKHRDIIIYVFFGGLTTLANFLVYFPLYNWFGLSGAFSNAIAWVVAVVFAFFTNKPFVFHSNDWSAKTVAAEFARFVGCRIASGLLETATIFVFVDWFLLNGNWIKVAVSVVVVILNYIFSKCLVFKRSDQ